MLFVLALVVAALGSIVVHSLRIGISPMPSSRRAVSTMLALFDPSAAREVLELGAGWGALAFAAARRMPHAHVTAWESSPVPFAFMWLRRALARLPNLELRFGDFAQASLREADVVLCYLWPGAMTVLEPRFRAELKPAALVVSNTFGLRGWAPIREVTLDDVYRTPVLLYSRASSSSTTR